MDRNIVESGNKWILEPVEPLPNVLWSGSEESCLSACVNRRSNVSGPFLVERFFIATAIPRRSCLRSFEILKAKSGHATRGQTDVVYCGRTSRPCLIRSPEWQKRQAMAWWPMSYQLLDPKLALLPTNVMARQRAHERALYHNLGK